MDVRQILLSAVSEAEFAVLTSNARLAAFDWLVAEPRNVSLMAAFQLVRQPFPELRGDFTDEEKAEFCSFFQ